MSETTDTVFVIDDDESVRTSLRLLLNSAGLESWTLSSAREFLETYRAEQPGCLVLDVRCSSFRCGAPAADTYCPQRQRSSTAFARQIARAPPNPLPLVGAHSPRPCRLKPHGC